MLEPNFAEDVSSASSPIVAKSAPSPIGRSTIGGFNVTRATGGQALIDLGSGYSLSIDDIDRQVILENQKSLQRTVIYGNAKIAVEHPRAAEIPVIAPLPVVVPAAILVAAPPAPLPAALVTETISEPAIIVLSPEIAALVVAEPLAPAVTSVAPEKEQKVQPSVLLEHDMTTADLSPVAAAPAIELAPAPAMIIANTEPSSSETVEPEKAVSSKTAAVNIAIAPVPTEVVAVLPPQLWQFWGTTSFVFGDDQKITLETADVAGGSDYWLDRITVTSGTSGVVITGVADDTAGAVTMTAADGYDIDEETRDGLTLEEQPNGAGWQDEDGAVLSQAVLDETAVGADFGPGSSLMSRAEVSIVLNRIFAYGFVSSLMASASAARSNMDPSSEIRNDSEKSTDRRRVERLVVDQILAQQANEARRMERGDFAQS